MSGQIQLQMGSYLHPCTNETHPSVHLQDLIQAYIIICIQYTADKVWIKSCRCAGGCVLVVHGCSYPAAIIFDQTHIIAIGNAVW